MGPTIAIAVKPPVLGEMIFILLRRAGLDEVRLILPEISPPRRYDAVIRSPGAPTEASVVIELPDDLGGAGVGIVMRDGKTERVRMEGLPAILRLLDEHCPSSERASVPIRPLDGLNRANGPAPTAD